MTTTYVLTVADCPKSVNAGGGGSRSNPYVAAREKAKWEGIYLAQLMIAHVPKGMTHCNAEITVRWYRKNHADKTNYYHPIVKPLGDVLAPPVNSHRQRWLPDDTQDYFQATLNDFEYPKDWPWAPQIVMRNGKPYKLQLHKVEMIIKLEATYENDSRT